MNDEGIDSVSGYVEIDNGGSRGMTRKGFANDVVVSREWQRAVHVKFVRLLDNAETPGLSACLLEVR